MYALPSDFDCPQGKGSLRAAILAGLPRAEYRLKSLSGVGCIQSLFLATSNTSTATHELSSVPLMLVALTETLVAGRSIDASSIADGRADQVEWSELDG